MDSETGHISNIVHIPDMARCPEYGQVDVRIMVSFYWPYSRHHFLMSGIWPFFTVHIRDINFWCLEYGKSKLSIFRTSKVDVWNMDSENWPSLIFPVHIRDITVHIPDINFWCPEYGQWKLSIFRTSTFDVRNMDSRKKNDVRNKDSDIRNMDNDVWNRKY